MSSPVHHPEDLDAALMYAPPWARKHGARRPRDWPAAGKALRQARATMTASRAFNGDRAMLDLQRRLSLDPDEVPEPPVPIDDGRLWIGSRCGFARWPVVAALVAWADRYSLPIDMSLPFKPRY